MSEVLLDDLEEGEIADDIVPEPEPITQKNPKSLPRRYVINDKKLKSRHRKKSCKHASEHHKRKPIKSNFHSKPSIHHHKISHKHNSAYSKFPFNSYFDRQELIDIVSDEESHYSHKKVPVLKSAFKNYTSPPRKVLTVDNPKLSTSHQKADKNRFPKSPAKHKKSPQSLNKLKNISNFNGPSSAAKERLNGKSSRDNSEISNSKHKSENLQTIEVIDVTDDDDEDEEELRRIALATCLKRSVPEISSEDSSSKINYSESENLAAVESDNYEIVDMDVDDNETETTDQVGDLFVIDTTPTYFCERPPMCLLDQPSNINQINDVIVNGFLSNINVEDTYQNLNSDTVLNQNLNNDLYTNFEIDSSRLPTSQIDDEFEEELLRAELIANMKSMRQNDENLKNKSDNSTRNSDLINDNITGAPKDTRIVKLKSDINNHDKLIDSSVNDIGFRDERTVSIIKDVVIKETPFSTKSRTVSSFTNTSLPNTNSFSLSKGADIKVKLNNVHPVVVSASNIITLPQERIIISLNNETSSDESDQENSFQAKQPEKNPAVASLEALISNARQESDEKKNTANLNGTSDALSCLSKAQQEEYNSLIKILAKKKDPFVHHLQEEVKKVTEDANLILLKKKIHIAKDNYEKEKKLMNTMMKDLIKKKRSYMLSKIKTQQLKEQLVAAEKVRKANLQIWTKSASELQTLKKSVNKRQALIKSLQTKIGSYFPDTVSSGHSPVSKSHLK